MLGKPICIDDVPHFDVGQDPAQGNLRETGAGIVKPLVFMPRKTVVLSELELADMLRTD